MRNYKYDVTGKVRQLLDNSNQPKVEFTYNEKGQRQGKKSYAALNQQTYYVRDNSGNVLAIYQQQGTGTIDLLEVPLYGSGRIGTYDAKGDNYQYELNNHLGTTMIVFDRKKSTNQLEVLNYSYYFTMGSTQYKEGIPYRYGYQGQYAEKDEETGYNAFELSMYDPVIGRWMTKDPKGQYASPYVGMGNNWANGIDPDGAYSWLGAAWRNVWYGGGGVQRGDNGEWGYNTSNEFSTKYNGESLKGVDVTWNDGVKNRGWGGAGGSWEPNPNYFEGMRIYTSEFGALKYGAAFTIPSVGIFMNPNNINDLDQKRHEFGHELVKRRYGWNYFTLTAIESLKSASKNSAKEHYVTDTEVQANTLSYHYFNDPKDWNPIRPIKYGYLYNLEQLDKNNVHQNTFQNEFIFGTVLYTKFLSFSAW